MSTSLNMNRTDYLEPQSVDEEIVIIAHTLFGQVLGFRAAREFFLRRAGWVDFGDGQRAAIVTVLRRNIACLLDGFRQRERSAARPAS